MTPLDEQLTKIRILARECDTQLRDKLGEGAPQSGCLFVGTSYAKKPRLFLGLNPGESHKLSDLTDGGDRFSVSLPSMNAWEDEPKDRYWKNFASFLGCDSHLGPWFESATASFCCPWRTANADELARLNRRSAGNIAEMSSKMLGMMWEHHSMIGGQGFLSAVVAGKASLNWLARVLGFEWQDSVVSGSEIGRGTYQWRKIIWGRSVIYQVPHFSRANSHVRLAECAAWLSRNLDLNVCS